MYVSDKVTSGWLDSMQDNGYSPATRDAYARDVARYGPLPEPTDREGWQRRARIVRESGLAPRSVARHLASHAAAARFCGVDPTPFMRRPRMGVVVPAVVPDADELRRFVAAEPDPTWRALWALLGGAGLRISEALAVRDSDIGAGRVRVYGKGGKVRDVPLSPAVAEHCSGVAFPLPFGVRAAQRRVKVVARAAGLPASWHPHCLRHGFATTVYEVTRDLRLTGDLLGHVSLDTTKVYTHVRDERRVTAVSAVL